MGKQAVLPGGIVGHVAHGPGRGHGHLVRVVIDGLVEMGAFEHVAQRQRRSNQFIGQRRPQDGTARTNIPLF